MNEVIGIRVGFVLLVLTFVYLSVKVFFSLDLTDEMQYYGQIQSLVVSDKLFNSDLFFQQSVYLVFYPIFKVFFYLNPELHYFILFGRIVYLALILVTVWSFAKLMQSYGSSLNVQMIISSLLIAILAHRIFSVSYNTVSYCLIVLVLSFWFRRFKTPNTFVVGLGCALLTISYPPVGISLTAMLCIMRAVSDRGVMGALSFGATSIFLFTTIVVAAYVFGMIETRNVLDAIEFSQNFGSVGSVQTFGLAGLGLLGFFLAIIVANFLMIIELPKKLAIVLTSGWVRVLVLAGAFVLICSSFFHTQYWKLSPILIFLVVVFAALSRGMTKKSHPMFFAFMNIGTVIGATYSLSSGDSFYQLPFGLSLLIPFMLFSMSVSGQKADAVKQSENFSQAGVGYFGAAAFIVLVFFSLGHPYREGYIYKLDSIIYDVPAFKGIFTSHVKHELISTAVGMVNENNIEPNSSVLVVGPNPWLYFALRAKPVTPMFYMHFSGSGKVYELIEDRLVGQRPDWVLYTSVNADYSGLQTRSLEDFLRNIAPSSEYRCNAVYFEPLILAEYNPSPVHAIANPIDLCKKASHADSVAQS